MIVRKSILWYCAPEKKFRSWNHLRKGMKEIIKSVIDYA
jgi:hypothetical protein